jgi:Nuclease-related domain
MFAGLPIWLWVLFAVAAAAAAVFLLVRYLRQLRARRAIDNLIGSVAYDVLKNVLLPTGTGEQIHVNYLLLTQRGLLVVDLIDVPGVVFAGEKMGQWSVFGPQRHFTLSNPLPLLYDRVAAVRAVAGDVAVDGRIVFSMRSEFPKGRPDMVLRLDALQDEFPVVDRSGGATAAAFAPVWERIKQAAQPNPLAG